MTKIMTPAFVRGLIVTSVLAESLLSTPPTMQRMRAMSVRMVSRWNISEWKAWALGLGDVSVDTRSE